MTKDKLMAIQRAVRIVVEFNNGDGRGKPPDATVCATWPGRTTLAELIAKEIVEAVREEREACARKADGLAYRKNDEQVQADDRCDTAQKIAKWIRERSEP